MVAPCVRLLCQLPSKLQPLHTPSGLGQERQGPGPLNDTREQAGWPVTLSNNAGASACTPHASSYSSRHHAAHWEHSSVMWQLSSDKEAWQQTE